MTFVLEFAAGGIAHLLQAPAESFDKTILYIRICSAGIVIIIAYNVISGVLRGVGNANLPLLFVGIACVINILGDLLLVGVFTWMLRVPPLHCICTVCLCRLFCRCIKKAGYAYRIFQRTMSDL